MLEFRFDWKNTIIGILVFIVLLGASFGGGYYYAIRQGDEKINDIRNTITELEKGYKRLQIQNKYTLKYNKAARERLTELQEQIDRNLKRTRKAKEIIRGISEDLGGTESEIQKAIETVRRVKSLLQLYKETEKPF